MFDKRGFALFFLFAANRYKILNYLANISIIIFSNKNKKGEFMKEIILDNNIVNGGLDPILFECPDLEYFYAFPPLTSNHYTEIINSILEIPELHTSNVLSRDPIIHTHSGLKKFIQINFETDVYIVFSNVNAFNQLVYQNPLS